MFELFFLFTFRNVNKTLSSLFHIFEFLWFGGDCYIGDEGGGQPDTFCSRLQKEEENDAVF